MHQTLRHAFGWLSALFPAAAGPALAADPPRLPNEGCLECHKAGKKIEVPGPKDKPRTLGTVDPVAFGAGAHKRMWLEQQRQQATIVLAPG